MMTMGFGKVLGALAAAVSLSACDLVFDPGPPAPTKGNIFLFEITPVRPALEVCERYDKAFSRNHTVTVGANSISIASNGGIATQAPLVAPGIYRTELMQDNLRMAIAFEDQHQTRSLVITELTNGCRWAGESRGPNEADWMVPRWPKATSWWRVKSQTSPLP